MVCPFRARVIIYSFGKGPTCGRILRPAIRDVKRKPRLFSPTIQLDAASPLTLR
jgi:hypothetical protein